MHNDPNQIAERLIQNHGIDDAFTVATEAISILNTDADNYRLSVWREVKQALQKKRASAKQPGGPEH